MILSLYSIECSGLVLGPDIADLLVQPYPLLPMHPVTDVRIWLSSICQSTASWGYHFCLKLCSIFTRRKLFRAVHTKMD